jgi:hypothetical protein
VDLARIHIGPAWLRSARRACCATRCRPGQRRTNSVLPRAHVDRDVVLLSNESDLLDCLSGNKSKVSANLAEGGCSRGFFGRDGCCFLFLGMATGSLWARPVWGIWWTWDARLTATLILWLIYVSYLVLRNVVVGDGMRTLAAVVAIFAYCDVPIVYMATRWWRTQHPGPVFFGGPGSNVAPNLLPAVQWNIFAWLAWGMLVVSIRYAAERRRQTAEQEVAAKALEVIA